MRWLAASCVNLLTEGRDFGSLTLPEWQRHSKLFDDSVQNVVTPEASVRARRTPQSTHPHAVRRRWPR